MFMYGTGLRFAEYPIYKRKEYQPLSWMDDIIIQIGGQHFWLWFCSEALHRSLFKIYISTAKERCLLKIYPFTRREILKF